MPSRKSRSNAKRERKKNAVNAQKHLVSIISNTSMPLGIRNNAVKHLVKSSSRNRLALPKSYRHWICRKCKSFLIPENSSRVRIRNGQRIITCLSCNSIRRFGGGPNFKGVSRDE